MTSARVALRILAPDDWRLWRGLRLQALAEAPDAFCATLSDWQGAQDTEERWRARLENVPFHAVALANEAPIGMVGATAPDGLGQVALLSMWVAPEARGRGAGNALVSAVVQWARDSGARSVVLEVFEGNGRALAFYRRNGFTDTGQADASPDGRRKLFLSRRLGVK